MSLILILLCLHSNYGADEGLTIVAVGDAGVEKDKISFFNSSLSLNMTTQQKLTVKSVQKILEEDFAFYSESISTENVSDLKDDCFKSNYSKLAEKNLSFCVFNNYNVKGKDALFMQAKLVKVREEETIELSSVSISINNYRSTIHQVADDIYQRIFQQESIFKTKIVFVSDIPSRGGGEIKELYSMDFDGGNKKRLTNHKGTVISPALSLDGKKVLYSLIKEQKSKKRNVNLRLLNLESGKNEILSSRAGINSGAIFMPDGENILLTMSHEGNAEIYELNVETKKLRRITKHFAPDVDPSINYTGTKLAFLSGRSGTGRPMIFISDPRGLEKDVKRISFVGKFNATPRFNPEGTQIAFSSWLDNRFDIFRVDQNGDNLYRLTKDFGSNEDPTYSKDGQFIAFSSQRVLSRRKAVRNIYIMTSEGRIVKKVTDNFGNCSTPRWSK